MPSLHDDPRRRRPHIKVKVVPLADTGAGPAAKSAAAGLAPAKEWVKIALVDEEGQPMAGESYRIVLPDGSERTGELDAAGEACIDDIDAGVSSVTVHWPQPT